MSRPRSVSLFPSPQNYNGLSTVVQLARKIDIGLFHFLYAHKDEDFLYFSDILKSCACAVDISAYACKIVKIFLLFSNLVVLKPETVSFNTTREREQSKRRLSEGVSSRPRSVCSNNQDPRFLTTLGAASRRSSLSEGSLKSIDAGRVNPVLFNIINKLSLNKINHS